MIHFKLEIVMKEEKERFNSIINQANNPTILLKLKKYLVGKSSIQHLTQTASYFLSSQYSI